MTDLRDVDLLVVHTVDSTDTGNVFTVTMRTYCSL